MISSSKVLRVTIELVSILTTDSVAVMTCGFLEHRYGHKGFKILVRFHVSRCRVFRLNRNPVEESKRTGFGTRRSVFSSSPACHLL